MSIYQMPNQKEKIKENNTNSENKMNIEGWIPTMPSIHIRNFNMLRTIGFHQVKPSYILPKTPRAVY